MTIQKDEKRFSYLTLAAGALFFCMTAAGGGQAFAQADLDHFLNYQVRSLRFRTTVHLEDQFQEGTFRVRRVLEFLNPAVKNPTSPPDISLLFDPDTHLKSYLVRGPRSHPPRILVDNQPGSFTVKLHRRANRLLVPASKDLLAPPPQPPDPSLHEVDHFLCYPVRKAEPKLPRDTEVFATDQFNEPESKLFIVKKPTRFCNPVDKNGEGIKNPDNHLMCYRVKRARGEPRHERVGLFTHDQFGQMELRTRRERELCVPSTKTVLPDFGDDDDDG